MPPTSDLRDVPRTWTCGRAALTALAALVASTAPAVAQVPAPAGNDLDEVVEPAPPTRASYEPDRARSRSYLIPGVELVVLNVGANAASQLAGMPWAEISLDTMRHNLTRDWVYDEDTFSVNQLAHPYGGAMLYSTARSSGHGFWTSTAYGFAGSLMWEVLMENEPPSINDQLTTSFGGAFIGEALHRWARSVRWSGGPNPGVGRQVLAAVIDPVGSANVGMFGERWRRAPPPHMHAYLAGGWNGSLSGKDAGPGHLELYVSHGLPSDPDFEPEAPFHHFDMRGQLDLGGDQPGGYLDIRGALWGRATGEPGLRAIWGLYGTYDYWDAQAVRASAFGLGPGIALHAGGDRNFVAVSAVAAAVPFGAAGGTSDVEMMRDWRRGPGAAGHLELSAGRTGVGVVRASARAIGVVGELIDDANETVVVTSAGAMLSLSDHHALGVDVVYSARSSSFDDAAMNAFDQAAQVRVMYAVTSDGALGGPRPRRVTAPAR